MNERRLFLLPFALLASCSPVSSDRAAQPPLAGARMGGAFDLIDQNGRRTTDRDFAGKYRLVYFGYTSCPDVCPTTLQRLMASYRKLEAGRPALAARLQPIFISVDPARDTPAVLKSYIAAFHPKLLGLTGSEAAVAAAARNYAVSYRRGPVAPGGGYAVDHSSQAVLYGPEGEPIAIIADDAGPDAVAADLARWLK